MNSTLEAILAVKQEEVDALKQAIIDDPKHPMHQPYQPSDEDNPKCFEQALRNSGLQVIAEIKRRSPSAGKLADIEDPVKLAHKYSRAGACAISILTDRKHFGGTENDLIKVANSFDTQHPIPLLRKDFIIDPIQIRQTRFLGAQAVLLIVAVLQDRLKEFIEEATKEGLGYLVEVHTKEELDLALEAGAEVIGVNNRNLHTFEVDLEVSKQLITHIPKNVVKVSESGIKKTEDAHYIRELGYDAILVGELLVTSEDPAEVIANIENAP